MKKEKQQLIMKGHSNGEGGFAYAPDFIVSSFRKGATEPFEFHAHQQYEIYMFHQGKAHYLINNQVFKLEPGMFILLDGTELHKAHVMEEPENYIRSTIHFSVEWIQTLMNKSESQTLLDSFRQFSHRIFTLTDLQKRQEIKQLVDRLEFLATGDPTALKESEIKVTFLYLLFQISHAEKEDAAYKMGEKSEKVQYAEEIASFLQKNFKNNITLDDVAAELNLSKSYLSHLFKEITGYTVMQYLMNYRLTRVKAMLEISSSKQTIKECAYACGFESDAHFNRFFKQKVGISPLQFKKNIFRERKKRVNE